MAYTHDEIVRRRLEPNFKFFVNKDEDRASYLRKKQRMKGEFLGACFDYIRWADQRSVMYDMDTTDLIVFFMNWKAQNTPSLLWNDREPRGLELPRKEGDREKISLETVLDRLNKTPKIRTYSPPLIIGTRTEATRKTVHIFDGWTLASYVQSWYEQGDAPLFHT